MNRARVDIRVTRLLDCATDSESAPAKVSLTRKVNREIKPIKKFPDIVLNAFKVSTVPNSTKRNNV